MTVFRGLYMPQHFFIVAFLKEAVIMLLTVETGNCKKC